MKFIFLISGMNSWENSLPIIYELSKKKKNKITIGIETHVLFTKFLKDKFRKNFIEDNKISLLYLDRPKSLNDIAKLFLFYLKLIFVKFNFILETIDFDQDLKLTNFFLKYNLFLGCKRVKIFSDSLSENELKNTQIFYDIMNIKNKKLNFLKYDLTILSNEKTILKKIFNNIEFSKNNINLGKIKLNDDWLKYINNYYTEKNLLSNFDILIPLSATQGKFLRGYNSSTNEKKLNTIFEILSEFKNLKIVFKPHSKSDMNYFKKLIDGYDLKYSISDLHLNYLCNLSKLVLTYHPTSAQIYAKHFKKNVIEYGEYDQKIENLLNGNPRYFESVDKRVRTDKKELKETIEYYLNRPNVSYEKKYLKKDTLSDIHDKIGSFDK